MRSSQQVKITELRKFKHGCGLQGCNICTGERSLHSRCGIDVLAVFDNNIKNEVSDSSVPRESKPAEIVN